MLSIIITTYNRPEMLKQAIDSVNNQNFSDKEIIVIDDNSTVDNSFCIPYVTKYIKNIENKGLGANHKIGFEESNGEFVCFLDDDDYYTDNDFFPTALQYFQNCSDIIMVCASSKIKYEPSNREETVLLDNPTVMSSFDFLCGFGLEYKKPLSTFTTIFRKKALLKAGFELMEKPTDTCLYLRALTVEGKVICINKPIGHYRIHEVQMTKAQNYKFIIEVLKEKYEILKIIQDKIPSPNFWWYKQVRYTFDYYLGANPRKQDILYVLLWSFHHSHGSFVLLRYLIKIGVGIVHCN